jgi:hypothetical protein
MRKLLTFQESFNKFLYENEDLSKQKNAKEEVMAHLQTLYEGLWDGLEKK